MTPLEFEGKRVLVTGSNGFIGAHLVQRLLALQADVVGTVSPGSDGCRLEALDAHPRVLECDLSSNDHVARCLSDFRPHYVFHLGVERDQAVLRAAEASGSSAIKGQAVMEAVASSDLRRFLSLGSSLEVAFGLDGKLHTFHGRAKAREWQDLQTLSERIGAPYSHARTHYVYGPLQPRSKLIPTALAAAIEGRTLSLTGSHVRKRFVFVLDVVDGLLALAASPSPISRATWFTSDTEVSNRDVVERISAITGRPIKVAPEEFGERDFDCQHWPLDADEHGLAGWAAATPLDAGLTACYEWMCHNEV
ncbi:MAG: NAD(P)-dependent oxidoreductase [Pseudomonadota bacterium]